MADAPRIVIDNTLGAAYIGVILAGVLYGVTCVQTWFYYDRYPKDHWFIKALVALAWIFDTVHQALISHTVYTYVISNFANPLFLLHLEWSVLVEVIFTAFITLFVQCFLTFRIWHLSDRNLPLLIPIISLILSEFGCSFAYAIKGLKLKPMIIPQLVELRGVSISINVLGAAGDILIAGTLCYYLYRSRTGFKRSNAMISKLILFAVSTGVLTSICALASLISILIWPSAMVYLAFYFCLGRLYSNSFLATLNARQYIRELGTEENHLSFKMQPSRTLLSNLKSSDSTQFQTNGDLSVKIDTQKSVTTI